MENERNTEGETPLLYAARKGKHRAFKALLTKGKADPLLSDDRGYSPLDLAAEGGHTKIVQSLITHGVALSVRHADGYTPLHRAVRGGHTDTVKALLNADVPVEEMTAEGKTSLDLAADLEASDAGPTGTVKTQGAKAALAMKEVLQKFTRAHSNAEKGEL